MGQKVATFICHLSNANQSMLALKRFVSIFCSLVQQLYSRSVLINLCFHIMH